MIHTSKDEKVININNEIDSNKDENHEIFIKHDEYSEDYFMPENVFNGLKRINILIRNGSNLINGYLKKYFNDIKSKISEILNYIMVFDSNNSQLLFRYLNEKLHILQTRILDIIYLHFMDIKKMIQTYKEHKIHNVYATRKSQKEGTLKIGFNLNGLVNALASKKAVMYARDHPEKVELLNFRCFIPNKTLCPGV